MNPQIVIPVAKKNINILKKNLKYIKKNLKPDSIYILTSNLNFDDLKDCPSYVTILDEDTIISGTSFSSLKEIIKTTSIPENLTGWYYQQFLKLFWSKSELCADYYTVWDADTFPIKNIKLFSKNNNPYIHHKSEYNSAYFETLEKILGLSKIVDYSFISEKMTFSKDIVIKMLEEIDKRKIPGKSIIEKIIFASSDASNKHAFSEFETYGTYITKYYPDVYEVQTLKSYRNGAKLFGLNPFFSDISLAALFFDTISFENWDIQKKYYIVPFKIASVVLFPFTAIFGFIKKLFNR